MSVEERLLEAVEAEGRDIELEIGDHHLRKHQRLQRKNQTIINRFLGTGRRFHDVGIVPAYYGGLLTWALHRYIEKDAWRVVQTLGYKAPEPVYIDVQTDYKSCENLLMNGQMLAEKDDCHFIITVDIRLDWRCSVQVEGPVRKKEVISTFVAGVLAIAEEQNIYRGKKIEFAGRLRFLNLEGRSWESIILNDGIKREIRANTVDFLSKKELWTKYGIPSRRGVLLVGEPGTGKTIICKALMAEAGDITCITTNAYALDSVGYITDLYELAGDLSPCIVFIEDIDLIGQDREEFHYHKGSALMSLLAVLDGVEEKKEIVTVATTNCLDILDKALSQRPSRFDRVIKLSLPTLPERRELIRHLCQKIPLSEFNKEYIARRSEDCTPAQLQEIIYSLAIEHAGNINETSGFSFDLNEVDHVISRINGKNGHRLGFNRPDNYGRCG